MERRNFTHLTWFLVTLFYCYQYVLRPLPNIIMQEAFEKYGINASQFGSFAGIYYIGYVAVHIPIGILLMRFGVKIIMPICIILSALGLVPIVYSDSWTMVFIGRILTGVGSSCAALSAFQAFRITYPNAFSTALGTMVAIGLLCAVYSSTILSKFICSIGVHDTLTILIYIGLALGILSYFFLSSSKTVELQKNVLSDVKNTILNYRLILMSLIGGLMIGPLEGFADAWGSAFMIATYGMNKVTADSTVFSIFFGMFIGCLALPYIMDKTKSHFAILISSGLAMILGFIYIINILDIDFVYHICVTIGVFSAYQVVILSKAADFVDAKQSAIAGSVCNMIMMGFGSFFHNFIGIMLDNTEIEGQAGQYTSESLINAMYIIPISISIAVVGLLIWALCIKLSNERI